MTCGNVIVHVEFATHSGKTAQKVLLLVHIYVELLLMRVAASSGMPGPIRVGSLHITQTVSGFYRLSRITPLCGAKARLSSSPQLLPQQRWQSVGPRLGCSRSPCSRRSAAIPLQLPASNETEFFVRPKSRSTRAPGTRDSTQLSMIAQIRNTAQYNTAQYTQGAEIRVLQQSTSTGRSSEGGKSGSTNTEL